MTRKGGCNRNLLVNGGFENPNLKNNKQKYQISNNIPGWNETYIEIGVGA